MMVSTNGGEDGNKSGRKNMLQVVSFVILALNNADILSPEYNHVHEIGNSSGMRVVTYIRARWLELAS